jgi:hypothetical protein
VSAVFAVSPNTPAGTLTVMKGIQISYESNLWTQHRTLDPILQLR